MPGHFLAGIAALLWHPTTDRYLLLRRSTEKDFAAGIWECITGRVEQGESFEAALHREIREETGVAAQIEFFIGTSHFYRGEPRPANELLGVAYCCSITDPDAVRLSAEHSEMRWLSTLQALDLLSAPDPGTQWARRLIERTAWLNAHLPEALRHQARQLGFGLD